MKKNLSNMKKQILATALFALLALSAEARDYSIVDFGAKSDTTVNSTAAIQQAIDQCSAAGGGRVVVPAGNYKIGTLVLRSRVDLH